MQPLVAILALGLSFSLVEGLIAPETTFADQLREDQWHLNYLVVDELHQRTDGSGAVVAIVDTGVDDGHPDLSGNIMAGRDLTGDETDGRTDTDGHGTAMAALVAAHGQEVSRLGSVLGLAPSARIIPVRIGQERLFEPSVVARGIRWALTLDAEVISLSLSAFNEEVRDAVAEAVAQDVVVVAAVGNTYQGASEVAGPAVVPGVLAVSGVDRDGEFTPASAQGPEVVLAAPAVDIVSASAGETGPYSIGTGTSSAAALVSGAAALVRAHFPESDAANVVNRLIRTADDRGPAGRDPQYGYGIVDPLTALTADIPPVDTNPLLETAAPTGLTIGQSSDHSPTSRTPTPAARDSAATSSPTVLVLSLSLLAVLAATGAGLLGIARHRRRPHRPNQPSATRTPPRPP